jgi:hypothetical protein
LYAALLRNDISDWGDRFLNALAPATEKPRRRTAPPAGQS